MLKINRIAIAPLLLLVLAGVLVACSSEEDLGDSIYIPDSSQPGLPAYTEWGYNTFGAYYERETFIYSSQRIPFKVVVNDTATILMFIGERVGNYYGSQDMSMHIVLQDFTPTHYSDLINLNDTIVRLEEPNAYVKLFNLNGESHIRLLGGQLTIKRAQNLYVDDQYKEVILSGLFELQFLLNDEPMAISDGRFDMAVDGSNFFILE